MHTCDAAKRRKNEPDESYAWFMKFVALPPGSRRVAALRARAARAGLSLDQLDSIAYEWDWLDRAREVWDASDAAAVDIARHIAIDSTGLLRTQRELIGLASALALKEAEKALQVSLADGGPTVRPTELIRLLGEVTRAQQLLLGLPTDIVQSSNDYSAVEPEQLRALHEQIKNTLKN